MTDSTYHRPYPVRFQLTDSHGLMKIETTARGDEAQPIVTAGGMEACGMASLECVTGELNALAQRANAQEDTIAQIRTEIDRAMAMDLQVPAPLLSALYAIHRLSRTPSI